MSNLPTNYVDDVLNADVNTRRKYQMIQNSDGTVSLVDVTDYDTVGSSIGAAQINAQNTKINQNSSAISTLNADLTELSEKVGGGMKCALTGNGIAKGNTPWEVNISSLNLTSAEDSFVIINCMVTGGNYGEDMGYILTKTATKFTIKGMGDNGIHIGYQVITLK
jgi:membrane protease subunit (stomatin/prohibitin family)